MEKIISNIRHCLERIYPYVFAAIVTCMIFKVKFDFTSDVNFPNVLEGVITFTSIIIGFIGAMMPVILSMKNESKFIKYIFDNDEDKLFLKYIKVTIFFGLFDIILSLIVQFKKSMEDYLCLYNKIYYAWIFITLSFIILTYRSMSYMLTIIFSSDIKDEQGTLPASVFLDEEEKKKLKHQKGQ